MKPLLTALALALVVSAPPLAYAAGREARNAKPYACNPQAECLARAASLKGAAAEAAKRDCGRMPTTGTCFSPDDAQADRAGRTDLTDRKKK